eukprot:2292477-Prymnesium_polylepis.1
MRAYHGRLRRELVAVPLVVALARLPAELALRHLCREARRHRERRVARELVGPALDDVVHRVEPDVVRQLDRPHRVARS